MSLEFRLSKTVATTAAAFRPASYTLRRRSAGSSPFLRHLSATFYSTETRPPSPKPVTYDVVIVGGGLAGSALACALASSPVTRYQRVALLEASDLKSVRTWTPVDSKTFSNRAVSLTPSSVDFLKEIGAWDAVDTSRVQPYNDMRVWDGIGPGQIEFKSNLVKERSASSDLSIATMAENLNVHRALLRSLEKNSPNVAVIDKTKVEKIFSGTEAPKPNLIITTGHSTAADQQAIPKATMENDWPVVRLQNGTELRARLLIGADGGNSPVRRYANIESIGWDYNQNGLVATLDLEQSGLSEEGSPQDNSTSGVRTAYQRFLPTGPIALLPLPGNAASLVWTLPADLVKRVQRMPSKEFALLVNAAFAASMADIRYSMAQIKEDGTIPVDVDFEDETNWRQRVRNEHRGALGGVGSRCAYTDSDAVDGASGMPIVVGVQEGTRASFPLKMRNAERYVVDRVALVGDAAHTIHPMAGQGLNQGFADAQSLAKVIERGTLDGQDIGNIHLLTEYSSQRFFPNLAMAGAIDKLHKLFSTTWSPLVWARSFGLSAINQVTPIKKEIMAVAMGLDAESRKPFRRN